MIVTPFGDLTWGDKAALSSWIAAHDQRHHLERQVIAYQGVPIYPRDFSGQINNDWFGSHMISHGDLMDFALPDQTVGSVILEGPWKNEQDFYAWHQIHNLLHQRLDNALGIYS
jgi:hypothetical protein